MCTALACAKRTPPSFWGRQKGVVMTSSLAVRALVSVSLLLVPVLVMPPRSTVAGAAAKPASSQPCSVTISDDPTLFKITSDHNGSYVDGYPGVSCQVGGASNYDVRLVLSSPKRGSSPRAFWGDYSNQETTGGPTGTFADGHYLIINDIANMPIPSAMTGHAHFRFHNDSWFFNWCGGMCLNYPGLSDAVWVSRTSATHWDVSTEAHTFTEQSGDLAELQDNDTNSYSYHMPFHLTIDCATCR